MKVEADIDMLVPLMAHRESSVPRCCTIVSNMSLIVVCEVHRKHSWTYVFGSGKLSFKIDKP